ncbi:hypothetical protein RIF29_14979 [Crotalaria pallida]|uniref:Uncharacterized protein n=1 Tax=Crotalaria pallida TaxID=3830 RepID=A0AAN9FCB5_CROPI
MAIVETQHKYKRVEEKQCDSKASFAMHNTHGHKEGSMGNTEYVHANRMQHNKMPMARQPFRESGEIDHAERVNEVVLKHDHHRLANQIVRAIGKYSLAGPAIWSCCGKQQDEFPEYVSRARVEHFIEMDYGDKST